MADLAITHSELTILKATRPARMLYGTGSFGAGVVSGALPVLGFTEIDSVFLTPAQAPTGLNDTFVLPLGTISATMGQTFSVPKSGTVLSVTFTTATNVAADTTNTWTFRLTNRGGDGSGSTAVILADSSNSTDSDAVPAGFSITGYTPSALFKEAAANLVVASTDMLEFTATKAGTATTMTGCSLKIITAVGSTGGFAEVLSWTDTLVGGLFRPTNSRVNINRSSIPASPNPLKFSFIVMGR